MNMSYFIVEGSDVYRVVRGYVVSEVKTRELAELFLSAMRLKMAKKDMRGEKNEGKKVN